MKHLIVIGGPTAAGKTALAIRLAKEFKTEILSADSRQFFREMTIGTAKPTREELAEAKHHFIDSLSVEEDYDTGKFEHDALQLSGKLFQKHDILIMVGGSGLYLNAFVHGIDRLPAQDPEVRNSLRRLLEEKGIAALQNELIQKDPETSAVIDLQNPHRLIRALEVCRITGMKYSQLRTGKPAEREFVPVLIALAPERTALYKRIDERVDQMIRLGLIDEVRSLYPFRQKNALKTVGYRELFDYLDNKTSLEEAIRLIKQHSRNYAKRQMTWFRNQSEYTLFNPDDTDSISRFIEMKLK